MARCTSSRERAATFCLSHSSQSTACPSRSVVENVSFQEQVNLAIVRRLRGTWFNSPEPTGSRWEPGVWQYWCNVYKKCRCHCIGGPAHRHLHDDERQVMWIYSTLQCRNLSVFRKIDLPQEVKVYLFWIVFCLENKIDDYRTSLLHIIKDVLWDLRKNRQRVFSVVTVYISQDLLPYSS